MKLLSMQFYPVACYFLLGSNVYLGTILSNTLSLWSFLCNISCNIRGFTRVERLRKGKVEVAAPIFMWGMEALLHVFLTSELEGGELTPFKAQR